MPKLFDLPADIKQNILNIYDYCWTECKLAEGDAALGRSGPIFKYSVPMNELPCSSFGSGLTLLLSYLKNHHGLTHMYIQENTMRADLAIPQMLGIGCNVVDCTWPTGLGMSPVKLEDKFRWNAMGSKEIGALLITPIGGYLHRSVLDCIALARKYGKLVIIDAAHSQYLLNTIDFDAAVYSFYATKVIPLGEGGLIATPHNSWYDALVRMITYDKKDCVIGGFNARMEEPKARVLRYLAQDTMVFEQLVGKRLDICRAYTKVCEELHVPHMSVDTMPSNGYKFIIQGDFKVEFKTSMVFDTMLTGGPQKPGLYHTCPSTYPSLDREAAASSLFDSLKSQLSL